MVFGDKDYIFNLPLMMFTFCELPTPFFMPHLSKTGRLLSKINKTVPNTLLKTSQPDLAHQGL